MTNELAPRVPGSALASAYYVQRCTTGLVPRDGGGHGYDGNWAQVVGCELAFAFKLRSGDLAGSVTCPVCGQALQTTTRRLRQGFLVLTDAEVKAVQDANGWTANRAHIKAVCASTGPDRWERSRAAWGLIVGVPVPVACVAPIAPAPVAEVEAPAPAPVKQVKLVAAEAALAAFDAKPRCEVCWGYNASVKTSPRCGFCREWNQQPGDQTAQGDRDQYTWKRSDLVVRVVRHGGTPTPSPLGDAVVGAHIAERDARKAAERERRVARLRAQGVRV